MQAGDLDPELAAEIQGLMRQARAAHDRCKASPVGQWSPEQARAQVWPVDEAGLRTACGDVRGLYDTYVDALGGRARNAEVLLSHLARMAEDLAFVQRSLDPSEVPGERANAAKHLRDALGDLDAYLKRAQTEPMRSFQVELAYPDVWPRMVRQDDVAVGALDDAFARLAYNQGFDVSRVRVRMLASLLRMARAEWQGRVVAMASVDLPEPERRARRAYLQSVGAVITTHEEALEAYVAGHITHAAARDERQQRTRAVHSAWRRAWIEEQARSSP